MKFIISKNITIPDFFFHRFIEKDLEGVALLQYHYEHSDDINGVVIASDIICRYFNVMNSPHRRIEFSKDRLFLYTMVYYFPKRSPFEEIFNVKVQEFQDAGILIHYVHRYDDRHRSKYYKSYAKFQISGLFAPLGICVFILEMISKKYQRIKYFIDFFTY